MSESRSRYIPVDVVRELRLAARDRCCLRGHLILEEELNDAMESDTLHLHHILHFSEDGPNTEENLMLVCPSCHARVHSQPKHYPGDALREAKRHWIRMRELVPAELVYEADDDESRWAPTDLVVRFRVESFNLPFCIRTPATITFGELSRFVGNWILRPLTYYTRTAPFPSVLTKAHIGRVSLAAKTQPDAIFPAERLICEVSQLAEVELISLVDLRMVAALRVDPEESPATQTVTLRWGSTPSDLDLHFVHRSASEQGHVWYRDTGTLERYPWARLNEDVRHGHGPEVLSFGLLARGRYALAVHNYSGDSPLAGCGATVEVAIGDTVREFRCPNEGSGDWWTVFEFDIETHRMEVLNRIVESVEWAREPRFMDPQTIRRAESEDGQGR